MAHEIQGPTPTNVAVVAEVLAADPARDEQVRMARENPGAMVLRAIDGGALYAPLFKQSEFAVAINQLLTDRQASQQQSE